jgi:hypothetical protein
MSRKGPLNRRSLGCARDDKGGQRSTWLEAKSARGLPSETWDPRSRALMEAPRPFVIPSAAEGSAVQRTLMDMFSTGQMTISKPHSQS